MNISKAEIEVLKNRSPEKGKGSCASQGEKAAIIKELREQGYKLKYLLKSYEII